MTTVCAPGPAPSCELRSRGKAEIAREQHQPRRLLTAQSRHNNGPHKVCPGYQRDGVCLLTFVFPESEETLSLPTLEAPAR